MEDRGYLVAHPTLIDPKGHAPAEQQHITHKVKGQMLPGHHLVTNIYKPWIPFWCSFFSLFNSPFRTMYVNGRSPWWPTTSSTTPTLSRKTCATASAIALCSASTSSTPASWWVRVTQVNWMSSFSHTRPVSKRFEYLTVQHCHLVANNDIALVTPNAQVLPELLTPLLCLIFIDDSWLILVYYYFLIAT